MHLKQPEPFHLLEMGHRNLLILATMVFWCWRHLQRFTLGTVGAGLAGYAASDFSSVPRSCQSLEIIPRCPSWQMLMTCSCRLFGMTSWWPRGRGCCISDDAVNDDLLTCFTCLDVTFGEGKHAS